MILRQCFWVFLAILVGCAPLRKESDDGDAIKAADSDAEDAEPKLKVAYSNDDITAVEIIPEKLFVEPWQPVQLFLAGTLPDKTKGRIPSEVVWSVDDEKVAIIGKEGGQLIATDEGEVTITARFRKFDDERTIRVRWIHSIHRKLKEPKDLVGEPVDDTIARVVWEYGQGPISGHQLAYQEGAAPADCETVADGGKVVAATDIGDLTEVAIFGLTPNTTYGVRVCSVQELATEGRTVRRFSAGETVSVKTKTE